MFFSKPILFAISLGALSVFATPHALHHHALHRRAVAARVAAAHTNATVVNRQNSPKCNHHSPSSEIPAPTAIAATPNPIAATPNTPPPPSQPSPTTQESSPTSSPDRQRQPTTTTPSKPPAASAPTTSAPGAPASSPTAPGLTGGPFDGQGTWFATGLGACGQTNTASQFIVAVSEIRFDSFPGYNGQDSNDNPICGKQVVITAGGATATATVTDRCTACKDDDLDMTTGLFSVFADLGVGRIDISWNFA